jgi:hypothetical protein
MVRDQQKPFHRTESDADPLPPPPEKHQTSAMPLNSNVRKSDFLPHTAQSFSYSDVKMPIEEERCTEFWKSCKKVWHYVNHEVVSFQDFLYRFNLR